MNTQSKHNKNVKMSLLQMLLKSTLIVGLSACSSTASKEENVIEKGKKMMLNEIYDSKINPDHFMKIQDNYVEVTNIVLKYFKIGESKQEVISKLHQMGLWIREEANGVIIAGHRRGEAPWFLSHDDAKTIVIFFEFGNDGELINMKSHYLIQQ